MKVVVLAGGMGTRFGEETAARPKPMLEIGGRPILWHIMQMYAHYGLSDFIICLGANGNVIRDFFINYLLSHSDLTVDLVTNQIVFHRRVTESWRVTLVDTGVETMTGGRIRRIAQYIADDESFCLTYADGVADVDVRCLIDAHINGGTLATVTAVQTPGQFGRLTLEDKRVVGFAEKYPGDGGWVNAGYFVLSTRILDYIEDDSVIWERAPIERLVREGQLSAYRHDGFWHCMDTPKDRHYLENLWAKGQAPWLVW